MPPRTWICSWLKFSSTGETPAPPCGRYRSAGAAPVSAQPPAPEPDLPVSYTEDSRDAARHPAHSQRQRRTSATPGRRLRPPRAISSSSTSVVAQLASPHTGTSTCMNPSMATCVQAPYQAVVKQHRPAEAVDLQAPDLRVGQHAPGQHGKAAGRAASAGVEARAAGRPEQGERDRSRSITLRQRDGLTENAPEAIRRVAGARGAGSRPDALAVLLVALQVVDKSATPRLYRVEHSIATWTPRIRGGCTPCPARRRKGENRNASSEPRSSLIKVGCEGG